MIYILSSSIPNPRKNLKKMVTLEDAYPDTAIKRAKWLADHNKGLSGDHTCTCMQHA